MEQAVDELTKCRLTLKWSYAMAYFLAKGNDKEIFEDLQAYVMTRHPYNNTCPHVPLVP
jgi:hypothetical protein